MVQRKWSKAVEVVFSLTRDIMNGIQDIDGIEKQQQMALDLFKFLGGIKDFEEASKKMMEMAIKVDEEWGKEEEAKDEGEKEDGLTLYVNTDAN